MKITDLYIHNFKFIHNMQIRNIENALILVGQNNTGKTTVLDAVRAVGGEYEITPEDFGEDGANIEISVTLEFTPEDLELLHRGGMVSQYRRKDAWLQDFQKKLPSFRDGRLSFTMTANRSGRVRCQDGVRKHNPYLQEVFPKIYYVDTERNLEALQGDLLLLQEDEILQRMRSGCCMFNQDNARQIFFNLLIRFQQRKQINAAHALAHP